MELYNTIFKRRSVRKYDVTPLLSEELTKIKTFLNSIESIPDCKIKLQIVSKTCVNNNLAPHYILAYCEKNTQNFVNTGYVLQKADLYLQSCGYGSQWLGMAKPKSQEDKENYTIMLAFGKTNVSERTDEKEFNRLPMQKISDADNEISRAVRIAPSAVNSQPWFLSFKDNELTISYTGRGILKAMLKGKMNKIDLGIALRHTVTALEHSEKTIKDIQILENGNDINIKIKYFL